jgi:hypothetical protein
MFKVKLVKLKTLPDGNNTNNIVEGRTEIGYTDKLPEVGESFKVESLSRWFYTSLVQEIISENVFITLNSVYHWEILL